MPGCESGRPSHVAIAEWPRTELSPHHRPRAYGARVVTDLGVSRLMTAAPILSILTFVPLLGGLIVIGLNSENKRFARWLALGFSLAALALTVVLWIQFDRASGELQFEEQH